MNVNQFVAVLLSWIGSYFNEGVSAQCAEFVSTCLDKVGFTGNGYHHTAWAPDFSTMGVTIKDISQLIPGDVVLFDNTYVQDTYTHVGVYVGSGSMVHRPTMSAPVEKTDITGGFYAEKFHEGRRLFDPGSVTATTNDSKGIPSYPVKIEWHDGLLSVVVDGKEILHTSTKRVGQGKLYLPEEKP